MKRFAGFLFCFGLVWFFLSSSCVVPPSLQPAGLLFEFNHIARAAAGRQVASQAGDFMFLPTVFVSTAAVRVTRPLFLFFSFLFSNLELLTKS